MNTTEFREWTAQYRDEVDGYKFLYCPQNHHITNFQQWYWVWSIGKGDPQFRGTAIAAVAEGHVTDQPVRIANVLFDGLLRHGESNGAWEAFAMVCTPAQTKLLINAIKSHRYSSADEMNIALIRLSERGLIEKDMHTSMLNILYSN